VYGDGRTRCSADGPLSDTENVLLSYLGRNFSINRGSTDTIIGSTRTHAYKGKQVAVTSNCIVHVGETAPQVAIVQHSHVVSLLNARNDTTVDAKIMYRTHFGVIKNHE
jgi:hypothetical protein